jgi:hypothetical protein
MVILRSLKKEEEIHFSVHHTCIGILGDNPIAVNKYYYYYYYLSISSWK